MADRVAYLGPKATYTHQAALQQFPPSSSASLVPSPSIASVFASVQDGESEYGVVPFENSSNGAVLPTLDLFASLPTSHPDVTIIGEQFVDVHHCLMGRLVSATTSSSSSRRPFKINASGFRHGQTSTTEGGTPQTRSQPSPDLQKLTVIHSHPQAWGQCTGLLSSLPNVEKVDSSSTSAAATKVASLLAKSPDGTTTEAAIASKLAAELNNLDILQENIEDRSDNQTRFFVLARKKDGPDSKSLSDPDASPASPTDSQQAASHKTLLHFRVPIHGSPGTLADALAVFKKENLSLCSMYTRPDPDPSSSGLPTPALSSSPASGAGASAALETTPGRQANTERRWRYIFFVEFASEAGQEEAVARALEELRGVTRGLCVVGRWRS